MCMCACVRVRVLVTNTRTKTATTATTTTAAWQIGLPRQQKQLILQPQILLALHHIITPTGATLHYNNYNLN